MVSNSRLAETSLSHEPELSTGKLWLAKKYQELEKFTNIIQAKQNQLGESNCFVLFLGTSKFQNTCHFH